MLNPEANMGKLLLAAMNPESMGKRYPLYVAGGLLQMQQKGAWSTTTANLWGTLAVGHLPGSLKKHRPRVVSMMLMPPDGEAQTWENMSLNQKVLSPWAGTDRESLSLSKQGPGRVWATVSALAAVPVPGPLMPVM